VTVPLTSQPTPSGQTCNCSLKIGGRKQPQIKAWAGYGKMSYFFKETKTNTIKSLLYLQNFMSEIARFEKAFQVTFKL
jgi:hypothetical protein